MLEHLTEAEKNAVKEGFMKVIDSNFLSALKRGSSRLLPH
jgi:hypothetical protein